MSEKKLTRILIEPISEIAHQRFDEVMCKLHTCTIENETQDEFYLKSANQKYGFVIKKKNDLHWKIVK
jgi:hypothetical protein